MHLLSSEQLEATKGYVFRHGRLLERQLYEAFFGRGSQEARVRALGVTVGCFEERTRTTPKRGAKEYRHGTLSARDCRHYWATMAARNGTPIDRLMDAGGWSSPAMPLRYVESAKIANQGVSLGEEP